MAIYTSRFRNNLLRVHVGDIESWDGFEEIAKYFEMFFDAIIINKADGVDARSWEMKIKQFPITLVHDDLLGNFFYSEDPAGEKLVKDLAEVIKKRIEDQN